MPEHEGPTTPVAEASPPASRRSYRAALHAAEDRDRSRRKAGRNLPAAVTVAVVLLGLMTLSLTLWKPAFVLLAMVAIGVGVWELGQALRHAHVDAPLPPLLLSVLLLPMAYVGGPEQLAVGFVLAVVLVLLWRSALGSAQDAVRDLAGGAFVITYLPLMAAFTSLMLAEDDGVMRIVVFVLVTIASDTGGYAVGVRRGRTPMAPQLSPKKSWEGFVGSVVTSAVVGVVTVMLLLGGSWWAGALVGALAAVFATVGDLAESAIKRDLGIKDMSRLLPGHGGVMDRLDSLLVTAPVCWALLTVLV